jgi:pimeloyl-ACP methyl ester carboxylesterase
LIVPVLAFGAEYGVGEALVDTMRLVAGNVQGGTIKDCGHFLPEECPQTLADEINRFMASPTADT